MPDSVLLAPRSSARRAVAAGIVAVVLSMTAGTASAQNNLPQEGLFVNVPNPITGEAVNRIKNSVTKARNDANRPIRTVIFDFNPGEKEAATSDFGVCYTLAQFISQLHELNTVGFVSANVAGHTVLPVLACKEVAANPQATFGEITRTGQPIIDFEMGAYDLILSDARSPLRGLVRKMADRGVSLGKGTKRVGNNDVEWFIDLRDKDQFVKSGGRIANPNPLPFPFAPGGAAGVIPADKGKQFGLVKVFAQNRAEVAALYNLNPANLREDPLGDRPTQAFRYVLRGSIDGGVKEATKRVLQRVVSDKGTILFVQIECGDGDLSAARDIADAFQKAQQGDEPLVIVGFLPDTASPVGTVIAFGCSEIVMSKRTEGKDDSGESQEAEIGDFSGLLGKDPNATDFLRKNLKELVAARGVPEVLIDGMLDRELEIVRAHPQVEKSKPRLLTRAELEAEPGKWAVDATVKPKGQLLKMNATRAVELGVARFAVEGRETSEVYALYGVESSRVKEATPGWLDRFATFLRLPPVTVLLVVIGFAGLVLELKVPGTTVPGIIAALCFILIFWAHTGVNGNAVILGAMLFLLGLVLIMIEVFVLPGFGAPGILGIVFMLCGIGVATMDRIPQTGGEWTEFGGKVGQYLLAMIGSVILAFTVARFLPNIPYANRLMLAPPGERPNTDSSPDLPGVAQAVSLLGAVGTAATTLRPAGMAQFGDQYVDVVTEGGFIAAGARVQVVEVEGTRIVVREV